jgi:hypothetical protein
MRKRFVVTQKDGLKMGLLASPRERREEVLQYIGGGGVEEEAKSREQDCKVS